MRYTVIRVPLRPITKSIMATTQIQNLVRRLLTKSPNQFMAWLDCLAPSVPEKPATTVHQGAECSVTAFCDCDFHYKIHPNILPSCLVNQNIFRHICNLTEPLLSMPHLCLYVCRNETTWKPTIFMKYGIGDFQ